jgi:hypothetical protein
MQSSSSPFVVNIVPLANVQTNTSGEDATTVLSNQVAQIQQMVNYDQKRIYTDYLGAFTTDGSIQVLSPLNLSNVGITSNGVPYSGSGSSAGGGSTIGTVSTSITLFDTTSALSTAMSFSVGDRPVFQILGSGNGLVYDTSGIATEFRISSMSFVADTGSFTSDVTVGGICYAQQFVTLSDERRKRSVSAVNLDGIVSSLSGVNTYYYKIQSDGDPVNYNLPRVEIGLLAQELEGSFPEVIQHGEDGTKYVKYNAVVALLLGAVRRLNQRVDELESRVASL